MSEVAEKSGGRQTMAEFARMYGANERTVKRWKARGEETGDPIVLADPEQVFRWWPRNMVNRIPAGITNAVRKWRIEGKSKAPAAPAPVLELPASVPALPAEKADARALALAAPVGEHELGPEQTLRRLQELEVRLSRTATDPGQAKVWLDTIARLGPAERQFREELERTRKLIPREEAETAIQSFHVPIKNETYLLASAMCQLLGLPLTPAIEENWRAECDRLFNRLQETVLAA